MKLYLILAVLGLVFGTRAMAGDVKNCTKLKITGRHECSLQGEKLLLNIEKVDGILNVTAESEKEAFIIDGNEHFRYPWSQDFTYASTCTKTALTIDSFSKGQSEGTIVIAPKDASIEYTISKGRESLVLSCRKL